jgi:hypothetical protein
MQLFSDLFISINCSTCFRRFLRPSLEAQNCTYGVRYCQTYTAASPYRGWDRNHPYYPRQQQAAVLVWQYLTLYVQFCARDYGRRNRLKHVEQFIEINRSEKICIFWVVLRKYICDTRTYERQITVKSLPKYTVSHPKHRSIYINPLDKVKVHITTCWTPCNVKCFW